MNAKVLTVSELLDGHAALDIQCLDRIYLNTYVPILQTSSQVVAFLNGHLGFPFASPALFNKIGQRFRKAVADYAKNNSIPWIVFGKGADKLAVMAEHIQRQAATGCSGIAAIGVAQEFQRVWTASEGQTSTGTPRWSFFKADRRVTCYYFYLWDDDFGPGFIKVCAYFPYPGKVWINGHEWAKRQATKAGIGFTALSNGFATCDDPDRLQEVCDRLGPGTIQVFLERWLTRLPLPLDQADRDAGYWWEASMRQVKVSRTIVFDAPRHARGFFEALIVDNLDLGRPHNVEIIFGRKVRRDTPGTFRTAIDRRDNGGVLLNVFYKHSRIKQYLKDGRAMRIETVVNTPRDLGCHARLPHLDDLQTKARACNRRILEAERVGQGCVLAAPAFERTAHPSIDTTGGRTPALRFGDPRVMALTGALCHTLLAATGFTNKHLRVLTAGLLGSDYRPNQMTYDLRRLRLNGLIRRLPGSNRYTLTPDGIRIAIFYTKVYNRLLIPLTSADQAQAPPELRAALATITRHVDDYASHARLPRAA
ncbi:hypothetical protein Aca07nite_71550 [Actinoplanes capillaceus]|uniref:Uncharacterized protein n=1 Tax=Actinoplanes campanulatus TaxID=113559 RepID=A0ABQ3WUE8_9ACTN|nr:hypothetical protein [Actinoplanes capillaceus]GID49880.1 hypothetical protein Aca07nite_71550 [Actinoplanes capillaceus]